MIYIHIPFCRSFCTYCDFYSEVAAKCRRSEDGIRQSQQFEAFSKALGREISLRGGEMSSDVNTLYIGGGTPSVLPLSVYSSLMEDLERVGIRAPFDEFTFEANPEDIVEKGPAYVEGLLELGVNRFSMGVQSFDDGILKWMNRRHDAETARKAYAVLEDAGADNISIDLIFGLPQLSDQLWTDTLNKALNISSKGNIPRHISSYQLSVEPGSALAKLVDRGLWAEASDEFCSRQYEALCDSLSKSGYVHYEISNFAQPGFEAIHNSAYWKHVPYVGLGPGAHSFLNAPKRRQWNNPNLKEYISDPSAVQEYELLDEEQLVLEKLMLALRTSDGISASFLESQVNRVHLDHALDMGNLVHLPSGNIRIPENRFFISDNIISDLL